MNVLSPLSFIRRTVWFSDGRVLSNQSGLPLPLYKFYCLTLEVKWLFMRALWNKHKRWSYICELVKGSVVCLSPSNVCIGHFLFLLQTPDKEFLMWLSWLSIQLNINELNTLFSPHITVLYKCPLGGSLNKLSNCKYRFAYILQKICFVQPSIHFIKFSFSYIAHTVMQI